MYALSERLSNAYKNIGYRAIPDHNTAQAACILFFYLMHK